MKKTSFLDLPDLKIRVRSLNYAKDVSNTESGNYYCNETHFTNNYDMEYLFQEFIELGKNIYNSNNDFIDKIIFRESIKVYKTDKLILKRDVLIEDNILKLVKDWCKKCPVYFKLDGPEDYRNNNEIEIYALLDMAVFSYLTLSAINNYFLKKKDYDEYLKGNQIEFSTFTEIQDSKLYDFLATITDIVSEYERRIYNNNRPLLQESTALTFNETSKKCEFTRVFENIYSIFWLTVKAQIFTMTNGNEIFHICRCGSVVLGKSEHCQNCKMAKERERKQRKEESH